MSVAYDKDIVAWASEQAAFIRAGRFDMLDIEHISEEIEDVGRSERRELESRMIVLLAHLLKWKFQPARRGTSWKATIAVQRKDIAITVKKVPSLKTDLADEEWFSLVWEKAVVKAMEETGHDDFPKSCPWETILILNQEFLPD